MSEDARSFRKWTWGLRLLFALLAVAEPLAAQSPVGTRGSNGLIPQVRLDSLVIGGPTTLTVANRSWQSTFAFVGVATESAWIDLSSQCGPGAVYRLNPHSQEHFFVLQLPSGQHAFMLPPELDGRTFHLQAFVLDPGATGGVAFSDLITVTPARMVNRRADTLPYALNYASATQDPATGEILIFGGTAQGGIQQVDYSQHILCMNLSRPLGQEFRMAEDRLTYPANLMALAHDVSRRKVYLMGGMTPFGASAGIMVVDLAAPAGSRVSVLPDRLPMPRSGAAAALDASTGIIYLFGGRCETELDEIVAINPQAAPGQRVSLLTDRLPQTWTHGAAAWDNGGGRAWLMGGGSAAIYEFDPRRPSGSRVVTAPERLSGLRRFPAMARDPRNGRLYLFGGTQGQNLDEIVAFDPSAGAGGRLSLADRLPSPRYGSFAAFDATLGMVVVGGGINTMRVRELTGFDATAPSGLRVVAFSLPQGLIPGAAVFDGGSGEAYLLGGFSAGYQSSVIRVSARAEGRVKVVTLPETLPTPRNQIASAWDSAQGTAYLFGGLTSSGPLTQVVRFTPGASPGSRVQVLPDQLPQGLSGATAVWDPVRSVAYVFGGRNTSQEVDQVLEFNPARPAGSRIVTLSDRLPMATSLSTALWDPVGRVAFVLGGRNTDIVRFDPAAPAGQRAFQLPDRLPSSRTMVSAVFDARRAVFVLFGGFTSYYTEEIVRFDPRAQAGSRVAVEDVLLSGRYGTVAIHDSSTGTSLIMGGQNDTSLNEIWIYRRD